jgi:hypothetical protein
MENGRMEFPLAPAWPDKNILQPMIDHQRTGGDPFALSLDPFVCSFMAGNSNPFYLIGNLCLSKSA